MAGRVSTLPERRWLLVLSPILAAIFYAPLAWGATTEGTLAILDCLFAASFLGWVCLLVVERRIPLLSPCCWVLLPFIAILGSIHWVNPKAVFYEVFWAFNSIESAITWLPGTFDRTATEEVLIHLYAWLAGLFVLLDACSHSRVRWLLFKALAISGFVTALIGIFQKAGGVESMLWVEPDPRSYGNGLFFAAFRYHGNAASFLNLSWPAALAVFLRERDSGRGGVRSSIWTMVLVITVLGVFVNTSKAGLLLGVIGLILALIRFRKSIFVGSKMVMLVSGVMLLGLALVLVMPAIERLKERWSQQSYSTSFGGRSEAYSICLRMLPDSGAYGFGPGTFRLIFPLYQDESSGRGITDFFWYHAHQDYLQTLIEWGILGALAWLAFFAVGLFRGASKVKSSVRGNRLEYSTSCALIAMIIVLLHATVDFPFQIPAIQLPVAVYMAVLWAKQDARQQKRPA
ncbi:MAG: O-antigen ligase family protein [Verrucomicrobiales bacterium]|nr:O-antigen ligase family protein [Verrucomicrobiales bacterium]